MSERIEAAEQVARRMENNRARVVFAESCTAGLVAATLARVPGISNWLCGSAVTYREATKIEWLGVSAGDIQRHTAVSQEVAQQMATGVLGFTPEADISASVTGHLGPDAPQGFDGVVFVALARRDGDHIETVGVERIQLRAIERTQRQEEATAVVLDRLLRVLP